MRYHSCKDGPRVLEIQFCECFVVVGKMVLCRVISFMHRRPKGDQLDQANPVRNDETGLWQCPFCRKNDFPELSGVRNDLPELSGERTCYSH